MEFLNCFLTRFAYPPEACTALTAAQQQLYACHQAADTLAALHDAYCAGTLDYVAANEAVTQAAEQAGVHAYTALLLFYIRLAQPLEQLYEQHGIAPEIYEASMRDLLYKAKECFAVHGVWGTFVAHWFAGFFNLTRFALGRLQFERAALPCDCTVQGTFFPQGTQAINIHIPSSGPMRKADCEASFVQAKKFFGISPAVFMCNSWMLFPAYRTFLPPNSNIIKFTDFFTIVSQNQAEEFEDAWRLFGKDAKPPYTDLPQETALQRAFIAWLQAGNATGTGVGVFVL